MEQAFKTVNDLFLMKNPKVYSAEDLEKIITALSYTEHFKFMQQEKDFFKEMQEFAQNLTFRRISSAELVYFYSSSHDSNNTYFIIGGSVGIYTKKSDQDIDTEIFWRQQLLNQQQQIIQQQQHQQQINGLFATSSDGSQQPGSSPYAAPNNNKALSKELGEGDDSNNGNKDDAGAQKQPSQYQQQPDKNKRAANPGKAKKQKDKSKSKDQNEENKTTEGNDDNEEGSPSPHTIIPVNSMLSSQMQGRRRGALAKQLQQQQQQQKKSYREEVRQVFNFYRNARDEELLKRSAQFRKQFFSNDVCLFKKVRVLESGQCFGRNTFWDETSSLYNNNNNANNNSLIISQQQQANSNSAASQLLLLNSNSANNNNNNSNGSFSSACIVPIALEETSLLVISQDAYRKSLRGFLRKRAAICQAVAQELNLPESEKLVELAHQFTETTVEDKQLVYCEGSSSAQQFYLIKSGVVEVRKTVTRQFSLSVFEDEVLLEEKQPGQFFGHVEAILRRKRMTKAVAVGNVVLYEITVENFKKFCYYQMLEQMINCCALRLEKWRQMLKADALRYSGQMLLGGGGVAKQMQSKIRSKQQQQQIFGNKKTANGQFMANSSSGVGSPKTLHKNSEEEQQQQQMMMTKSAVMMANNPSLFPSSNNYTSQSLASQLVADTDLYNKYLSMSDDYFAKQFASDKALKNAILFNLSNNNNGSGSRSPRRTTSIVVQQQQQHHQSSPRAQEEEQDYEGQINFTSCVDKIKETELRNSQEFNNNNNNNHFTLMRNGSSSNNVVFHKQGQSMNHFQTSRFQDGFGEDDFNNNNRSKSMKGVSFGISSNSKYYLKDSGKGSSLTERQTNANSNNSPEQKQQQQQSSQLYRQLLMSSNNKLQNNRFQQSYNNNNNNSPLMNPPSSPNAKGMKNRTAAQSFFQMSPNLNNNNVHQQQQQQQIQQNNLIFASKTKLQPESKFAAKMKNTSKQLGLFEVSSKSQGFFEDSEQRTINNNNYNKKSNLLFSVNNSPQSNVQQQQQLGSRIQQRNLTKSGFRQQQQSQGILNDQSPDFNSHHNTSSKISFQLNNNNISSSGVLTETMHKNQSLPNLKNQFKNL